MNLAIPILVTATSTIVVPSSTGSAGCSLLFNLFGHGLGRRPFNFTTGQLIVLDQMMKFRSGAFPTKVTLGTTIATSNTPQSMEPFESLGALHDIHHTGVVNVMFIGAALQSMMPRI